MIGNRTRLAAGLALFALVALALASALPAAAQGPGPATSKTYLPLVGINFPAPIVEPSARFWAERYTLDAGGCTTLHWKITGAQTVRLDGEIVPAQGTQQVCPLGPAQFYWLEVERSAGEAEAYVLDLASGDPRLEPSEVIAQAAVQAVAPTTDVDPVTPGEQGGYTVQLASVVRLYAADASWNHTTASIVVPQEFIDIEFGGPVHWPVKVGQLVEFRAICDGAACTMLGSDLSYLYLRSE